MFAFASNARTASLHPRSLAAPAAERRSTTARNVDGEFAGLVESKDVLAERRIERGRIRSCGFAHALALRALALGGCLGGLLFRHAEQQAPRPLIKLQRNVTGHGDGQRRGIVRSSGTAL